MRVGILISAGNAPESAGRQSLTIKPNYNIKLAAVRRSDGRTPRRQTKEEEHCHIMFIQSMRAILVLCMMQNATSVYLNDATFRLVDKPWQGQSPQGDFGRSAATDPALNKHLMCLYTNICIYIYIYMYMHIHIMLHYIVLYYSIV